MIFIWCFLTKINAQLVPGNFRKKSMQLHDFFVKMIYMIFARIEQAKAGMGGSKIRARLVDIGRGDVFEPSKFKPIPEDLKKLEVYCQRYKLADLKPKGRDEGFSGTK